MIKLIFIVLDNVRKRLALLKYSLLYKSNFKYGKKFYFREGFSVVAQGKVEIGDYVFFNKGCSLNSKESITVGDNTIFGENVRCYDHNHRFNIPNKLIREQGYNTGSISIGSNCWIGSNVVILKGAKIGDNSIVGAGCIISTTIPPNSICKLNQECTVSEILI